MKENSMKKKGHVLFLLLLLFLVIGCTKQSSEEPTLNAELPIVQVEAPPPTEVEKPTLPTESPPPQISEKTVTKPVEEKELSFEEKVWKLRIDAAVAFSSCPTNAPKTYPKGYYSGPLIDSHFHIPNIPDSTPREDEFEEESDHPILGKDISLGKMACTLKYEGTEKVFAFFPVYPEIPEQMVEVAYLSSKRYPDTFVRFIMPPGHDNDPRGSPTVDAETLQEMVAFHPGLFQGYGEIGLYARKGGASELMPDDQRLREIYPLVKKQKLVVYFHPGDEQADNLDRTLSENPDIIFIVHGDQIQPYILDLMDKHKNIYFTMNDLYGDEWLLRPEVTKKEFMVYIADFEPLLEKDLAMYQKMIERHPDRFMWGTDRGDALWTYDRDVGKTLADYGRAFIGRLDPKVQELFAYKNAERLLDDSANDLLPK